MVETWLAADVRPEFSPLHNDYRLSSRRDDNYAANALFWLDAELGTGVVEPMRTEDRHQRKGLARHAD